MISLLCFLIGVWLPVTILSLDTAIAPYLGDLSRSSSTWRHLRTIYENHWCAATLTGGPCETFSEARHQPPPEPADGEEDHGATGRPWPRPLRSFARAFGLDHLTRREYTQVEVGQNFMMQGLFALTHHLVGGGIFLSEHPAIPQNPERVSMWTTAILQLFRQHFAVELLTIKQYLWGAGATKPTCILAANAPRAKAHLWRHALATARKPAAVAIGRHKDGTFKTAAHKEYPAQLSAGLAEIVGQGLIAAKRDSRIVVHRLQPDTALGKWLQDVAYTSQQVRDSTWLPDFQG